MTKLIMTQPDLLHFLIEHMRTRGEEVIYPAAFVAYVDGFITSLSEFTVGTERLFPSSSSHPCPLCDVEQFAACSVSGHTGAALKTCNRYFAALALDLLAILPLGLTLADIIEAMITVLDLERTGFMQPEGEATNRSWRTSVYGERELGVRIMVSETICGGVR